MTTWPHVRACLIAYFIVFAHFNNHIFLALERILIISSSTRLIERQYLTQNYMVDVYVLLQWRIQGEGGQGGQDPPWDSKEKVSAHGKIVINDCNDKCGPNVKSKSFQTLLEIIYLDSRKSYLVSICLNSKEKSTTKVVQKLN